MYKCSVPNCTNVSRQKLLSALGRGMNLCDRHLAEYRSRLEHLMATYFGTQEHTILNNMLGDLTEEYLNDSTDYPTGTWPSTWKQE